ncbi:MAG: hypothetical protein NTW87_19635 [Planctomycetota bacterium]|nr:hypothetical protein [Planctomycetota bacterium]
MNVKPSAYRLWLGVALLALTNPQVRADIKLPGLIAEHMVLQQEAPVRIWGWAADGEKVTVTFRDQTVAAVAEKGRWQVTLKPMEAGGPFPFKIAGNNTIEFKDVFVGEVWVSCGQSNMMMGLRAAEGGDAAVQESGKYPNLRLFSVSAQRLAETPQEELPGAWTAGGADGVNGFSAVSYFFGRALHQQRKVPIGLINAVAIVPAEAWIDQATYAATLLVGTGRGGNKPSSAFNGMIAPITPYAIRGAIYYQGEYNAGNAPEFRRLMPAVISSWRKHWGLGDFPFLFVQLPGFIDHRAKKDAKLDMPEATLRATAKAGDNHAWCEMREAQMSTWQAVKNTGMAITIDVGDPWDIHPRRKQPVGERLALIARALAYGEKIEYSGPIFDSLSVKGDAATIRFLHVGKGLQAQGDRLAGFELAGANKHFVWADASIQGDTVVLKSGEIPEPVYTRYAWAGLPKGNLYNLDGLPAAPFRVNVPGKARQVDQFRLAFANAGFEAQGDAPANAEKWVPANGAKRTAERAAEGKWSMTLPVKGSVAQDGIVPPHLFRYDWNSDITEPNTFRPGTIFGYSVSLAAPDGSATAYLRLCADSSAGANQYWGGPIEVKTSSPHFSTCLVANRMTDKFDVNGNAGGGVGIHVANSGPAGTLCVDGFSEIAFIRPKLSVSDTSPIDLGVIKPGATAASRPRQITNCQPLTLPNKRAEGDVVGNVPTLLYGATNVKLTLEWGVGHAWGAADHVGAKILGKDATRFEFVSKHLGASARELKLVGGDEQGGLAGGPDPESEVLVVRFIGNDEPGTYSAFVRVVTQAGNIGTLSAGKADEPLENLFYTDIPVKVEVTP